LLIDENIFTVVTLKTLQNHQLAAVTCSLGDKDKNCGTASTK